jgi:hypothetical protein
MVLKITQHASIAALSLLRARCPGAIRGETLIAKAQPILNFVKIRT